MSEDERPECERDDELPCDQPAYNCDECKTPCPDERAQRNIKACYTVLFDRLHVSEVAPKNFECPSDCSICRFGFRTREP
jgi:hypothetical protein